MKLVKIRKGEYQVQGTDWEIVKDLTVEGSNQWVIYHTYCSQLDEYLARGNDQLWHTLGEAKEMLFEYLETLHKEQS